MWRKKIISLFFLFLFAKGIFSQTYPVQLSTQLIPPYSGYLPDYADPSSEKLRVIVQFNDFSTPQYNVRLRFEIKGNGFTLVTKQLFNPPPLTVHPGVPFLLSGADLAPYLNSNNLDFIGINQSQYEQRMALPEGYYTICVKAFDYYNPGNIQVSNEACTQAWFTLSDPPFLNLPQCGKSVVPQTPQNLIFQWTPMNMSSPNSAMNTEYEFALWEMRPDSSVNPNQLVMSAAPVFSTTTNLSILNYGITEPPLNLYMKYAWRVRAKDLTGRDWFKNSGYSQVCTFVYGNVQTVLGNALSLNLSAQGVSHRLAKCSWNTQSVYTNYVLQVRKAGTENWFDYNCTQGSEKVTNLEPNTSYEARVKGEGAVTSDWSNVATFSTFSEPNYSCNDQTQLVDPLQAQPLPPAKAIAGLIIETGQFEVVVTQITPTGPPGWFSGRGFAKVFGVLPLQVQFNTIYIDDNNRHQQGVIQAVTQGITNWLHQWDVNDAEENATYVNGEIDSIYVKGNQVCVKFQGNAGDSCFNYSPDQNVIVVRDENGNQYTIQVNPPPPVITGPTNYYQQSNDVLDASDSTMVVFTESPQQNYGFDQKRYAAWATDYELIKLKNGKNYFVPYKSIAENQADEIYAAINIIGFNASKLSFKTDAALQLSAQSSGNNLYKLNIPDQARSVYAWYDGKKVGKVNVIALKQITKKLVIVPVNGANLSAANLQQGLNKIFSQANVSWSVITKNNFTFSLGNDGLEMADATLMSKYSPEMKSLRDAYQQSVPDYDKEAYYIFVVNNFTDAGVKGYMVRGRALGFVSAGASTKEIAHELAHGAFGLEHTFPAIAKNTSDNLLDYSEGTDLSKKQWEIIDKGEARVSWFDGEEDGSLTQTLNPNCFYDVSNKYLYAANGKIIKAPANTKLLYLQGAYIADGYIFGLDVDKKYYWADVPLASVSLQDGSDFYGYKTEANESINLNYLEAVPNNDSALFISIGNNQVKLYSLKNAVALSGSNAGKYDVNGGNLFAGFIQNGARLINTCTATLPNSGQLSSLQKELINKYKNFNVVHETYVYEQGQLITLLPNGKKYIRTYSADQLKQLKDRLRNGELNNDIAYVFERSGAGYKLNINYGSSVAVKAGYEMGGQAKERSAAALEKVLNDYLKDQPDLGAQHNQDDSQSFEDGKKIHVRQSNIWDLVCNTIKAGKELLQDAEIKPAYWNSGDGAYANNWINTPPLLSGAGNGVINEIKEIPQLVFMAADLATNKTARDKLWEGLKGLTLAKIKDAALNTISNWTDTYAQGGDPAWHQAGKDGVLVFTLLSPAGFTKNADDVLEKNVDDAADLIRKKAAKINPKNIREAAQNWPNEKKTKFDFADEYYANSGYTNYDNHLRGIDFDQTVTAANKSNGEYLYQYCYLDAVTGEPKIGSYFYENVNVDASKLGFDVEGRVKVKLKLNTNSSFLKSIAADIEDWVPNSNKIFNGGETQLFNPLATFSEIEIIN